MVKWVKTFIQNVIIFILQLLSIEQILTKNLEDIQNLTEKLETYGSDHNAHIFSINKEKYYKVNQCPEKSIYSQSKRGPNFDGLWLSEPFFDKEKFWETDGDNNCYPKESTYEISDNANILTEVEVYKVIC